jgi:hypothetical protein
MISGRLTVFFEIGCCGAVPRASLFLPSNTFTVWFVHEVKEFSRTAQILKRSREIFVQRIHKLPLCEVRMNSDYIRELHFFKIKCNKRVLLSKQNKISNVRIT